MWEQPPAHLITPVDFPLPVAAGVHDRVRGLAGGDQRDAGHSAVRPVPGDPDRGHGDKQHGQDHDRG